MNPIRTFLICGMLLLWVPCLSTGGQISSAKQKTWTLAFYLAGDNSMEYAQARNFEEIIRTAGSLEEMDVVVFFDRDMKFTRDNPVTSWKGTRVFDVRKGLPSPARHPVRIEIPETIGHPRFNREIADRIQTREERDFLLKCYRRQGAFWHLNPLGKKERDRLFTVLSEKTGYLLPLHDKGPVNLDATDAATLRRYICYVKDNFHSRYYALIMAGHGNGWMGNVSPGLTEGSKDPETYSKSFSVAHIQRALQDEPVDVLIMDACNMGDLESLWAMKDAAQYLVLNQIPIPRSGLDYTIFLRRLRNRNGLSPEQLSLETVHAYEDTYGRKSYPVCVSAFRTGTGLLRFAASFDRFMQNPDNQRAVRQAADRALRVRHVDGNTVAAADLIQFCRDLDQKTLEDAVSGQHGFQIYCFRHRTEVNGISFYLPISETIFQETYEPYRQTVFAKSFPHGWSRFLPSLWDTNSR